MLTFVTRRVQPPPATTPQKRMGRMSRGSEATGVDSADGKNALIAVAAGAVALGALYLALSAQFN